MENKIGIIGSGIVAKTLAKGFLKNGYEVMLGTRDSANLDGFDKAAKIGSVNDTAKWGEIIVLACKGTAAESIIKSIPDAFIKGKTIIDTTNPISDSSPDNGVIRYFTDMNESLMERLQKISPEANYVKCFNSIGNAFMVDPDFSGEKPTMFICGNNPEAKKEVEHILNQFGWEREDMGGVEGARAIEPLCILWCIPGFLRNQWSHAFRLLKK